MIDITSREMTSDKTPEYAVRVSRHGAAVWHLSWLPARRLTAEQARAGMELDEILSDPAAVDDEAALRRAEDRATRLGICTERAVVLLSQRLAERILRTDIDLRTRPTPPPADPAVHHCRTTSMRRGR